MFENSSNKEAKIFADFLKRLLLPISQRTTISDLASDPWIQEVNFKKLFVNAKSQHKKQDISDVIKLIEKQNSL